MTKGQQNGAPASQRTAVSEDVAGFANDPVHETVEWVCSSNPGQRCFRLQLCEALGLELETVEITAGRILYRPYELGRIAVQVNSKSGGTETQPKSREYMVEIRCRNVFSGDELPRVPDAQHRAGPAAPVFVMPDRNLSAWPLLGSPVVPELAKLVKPGAAEDLLMRAGLLKPGAMEGSLTLQAHDLVEQADLTWVGGDSQERYRLTIIGGSEAAAAASINRQISDWSNSGDCGFAVPQYISYDPGLRVVVLKELLGEPLSQVLTRCVPIQFGEVGMALAALHAQAPLPAKDWTSQAELAGLAEDIRSLERALPNLSGRLRELLRRLETHPAACCNGRMAIHGSLNCKAIRYDYSGRPGRRVGIRNWEALSAGDPHFDLGRLIADLYCETCFGGTGRKALNICVESLLDAYGHARQVAVDYNALRWQTAVALLRSAANKIMGRLPFGWPLLVEATLAQAEHALELEFTRK